MFTRSPLAGLLLLALFLFPQIHKAVHDLGHLNDFHCQAVTEKHFHEHHAECLICDYKQPVKENSDYVFSVSFIFFAEEFLFPFNSEKLIAASGYSRPSRAPPVF